MAEMLHHYIGGQRVAGAGGRTGDVTNPATGEVVAQVPFASSDRGAPGDPNCRQGPPRMGGG